MTNPFEDDEGVFHVLVNDEGQYSLWPAWVSVPGGWTVVLGSQARPACIQFVDEQWSDMRPRTVVQFMTPLEEEPPGEFDAGTGRDDVRPLDTRGSSQCHSRPAS